MADTLTRTMTTAAVLLVAAIAAVVSFLHVEHLAVTHGQTLLASALLPLSIDGTVAAMSLVMLRCARSNLPTPVLARTMLALAVLATLAANVAYGGSWGLTGALISGWPAVAFVGCVEVSVLMVRKTRPAMMTVPDSTLTVAQQAAEAGVSERTMYRRLATANGNGKAH